MTGGAGFAGQGRASLRNNKNLLNKRGLMKDNPYNKKNKSKRTVSNHDELKKYKLGKAKRETKTAKIIWTIIVIVLLVAIVIAI